MPNHKGTSVGPTASRQIVDERNIESYSIKTLEALGYKVEMDAEWQGVKLGMFAWKDSRAMPVELIGTNIAELCQAQLRTRCARLVAASAHKDWDSPLLIVACPLPDSSIVRLQAEFKMRIWDLGELSKRSENSAEIQDFWNGLGTECPWSDLESQSAKTQRLINSLTTNRRRVHLSPAEYENLVMEILSHVFAPRLHGFEHQLSTIDGADRYDWLCRIQPGHRYWDRICDDFRTRSILIECKNYQKPITPKQIFTTERYLSVAALRTVCFLVSNHGCSRATLGAAIGAMREQKKLFIIMSNQDLIELLNLREDPEGPEQHLDEIIYNFLGQLPR